MFWKSTNYTLNITSIVSETVQIMQMQSNTHPVMISYRFIVYVYLRRYIIHLFIPIYNLRFFALRNRIKYKKINGFLNLVTQRFYFLFWISIQEYYFHCSEGTERVRNIAVRPCIISHQQFKKLQKLSTKYKLNKLDNTILTFLRFSS